MLSLDYFPFQTADSLSMNILISQTGFNFNAAAFVHPTHLVFYIHGTYTCCLLHTRDIHLFILHMLSFTYTAHSFVHPTHVVFYIHLFILRMLSFTYTGHSFVHPTHVAFYIHGTFICSSYTCCLLHTGHSFESRPECECVFDSLTN